MKRRTVLVGNAPLRSDVGQLVDSADTVVRFNDARGLQGASGSRIDQLWLINHGGQMAEWLERDELPGRPAVQAAGHIVLPVPMLPGHLCGTAMTAGRPGRSGTPCAAHDPDRINHLARAREVLTRAGHRVRTLSVDDYRATQDALENRCEGAAEHFPSTGFIALCHTLRHLAANERIELVGFTFQGWRGHSWQAERRCVDANIRAGRVMLHPT